jgi:folate-binding protein YgfZ
MSETVSTRLVTARPRAYVAVRGPDAGDYLQRMLSNDVLALRVGDACDAMLLTAKARLIAPVRVLRRGDDDFLVLTEPELGERVHTELLKFRFAAKAVIQPEEHDSWLVLGGDEVLDERPAGDEVDAHEYDRWRIENAVPRWGAELDETILPAEAGLTETHVSFTKGCYPGQEPIARQHYRGKVNRKLRVLEVDDAAPADEIRDGDKVVGRITSAVPGRALGYVRVEVPDDAALTVGGQPARLH